MLYLDCSSAGVGVEIGTGLSADLDVGPGDVVLDVGFRLVLMLVYVAVGGSFDVDLGAGDVSPCVDFVPGVGVGLAVVLGAGNVVSDFAFNVGV